MYVDSKNLKNEYRQGGCFKIAEPCFAFRKISSEVIRVKGKLTLQKKMELQFASLILPAVILFTIGIIVPIFLCVYYSFTEWDGFSAHIDFVGVQNYIEIFRDNSVLSSWAFTIKFAVLNAFIADVLTLLLALLMDKAIKGVKIYRTIIFIPCLFSSIVTGFVWTKIYAVVLPDICQKLHLNWNVQLLGSADTVTAGLTIANIWQWSGLWMMIYLAALQSIPTEYYEAAKIDGVNAFQKFFKITLPLLMPAVTTCTIGLTTGALKTYDILVTSTQGGPGRSSTSIIYYLYTAIFEHKLYGYGSSIAVTLILLLLVVALVQLKLFRKKEVQL